MSIKDKYSNTSLPEIADSIFTKEKLFLIVILFVGFLIIYPLVSVLSGVFIPRYIEGGQPVLGGFTLEYISGLFSARVGGILYNSIIYAIGTVIIGGVGGVGTAWLVAMTNIRFKRFVSISMAIIFVTPPLFVSFGQVMLYAPDAGFIAAPLNSLGIFRIDIYSWYGLWLTTGLWMQSWIFLFTIGAMRGIDSSMLESARMTGGSPARNLWKITLPLVKPTIIGVLSITFIITMGLFGPAAVIGVPARIQVLVTAIYIDLGSFPPNIPAASTYAFIFLLLGFIAIYVRNSLLSEGSYVTVTGQASQRRFLDIGIWRWPATILAIGNVAVSLYLPYLVVLSTSFKENLSPTLLPTEVTYDNYIQLISDPSIARTIGFTFAMALIVGITLIVMGFILAFIIWDYSEKMFSRALEFLVFIPLAIPGVIYAVGMILGYSIDPVNIYGTVMILFVLYTTRFVPFAMEPFLGNMRQVDNVLLESAAMCGGSWSSRMKEVLLPAVSHAALVAFLLTFMSVVRELVGTVLLHPTGRETIMVEMYQLWSTGYATVASALGTILILIVLLIFYVIEYWTDESMF